MKNFMARHSFSLGCVAVTLPMAGILLVKFSPLFLLLCVLGVMVYLELYHLHFDHEWICANCGDKALIPRYRFCSKCGNIMHAVKKQKTLCPRGHRVSEYDKFCPKCGVSLITGRFR